MNPTRRTALGAVAVAVATLVAGCGGDDDDDTPAPAATTETPMTDDSMMTETTMTGG